MKLLLSKSDREDKELGFIRDLPYQISMYPRIRVGIIWIILHRIPFTRVGFEQDSNKGLLQYGQRGFS